MDSELQLAAPLIIYTLEKKKKRKNGKNLNGNNVKAWITQGDALGFNNILQLTTLYNTLQLSLNTFLPSKCK